MRPTVAVRRARTVVYAGDDPVNARGVIAGIRRENPRATIVRGLRGVPARPVPPGFTEAFPGVRAGPLARSGFDAMTAVLAALRRAGQRAQNRQAVIDAFRPPSARG